MIDNITCLPKPVCTSPWALLLGAAGTQPGDDDDDDCGGDGGGGVNKTMPTAIL